MPDFPRQRGAPVDPARLSAVAGLLNARRFDEALRLSEALLAEGAVHPLPMGVVAAARHQAGRFVEALDLYRRITEITPDQPWAWASLADGLFAARRPEEAISAWDRALALSPNDPGLLCGKAVVLQSFSQLEAAQSLFEQARAIEPGRVDALSGLATIALDNGDLAQAEALSVELLARAADSPAAVWLAARIAQARGDFAAVIERTSSVLSRPDITPEQRAQTLLLQSLAFDGADRAGESIAAAVKGKAIQHALYAERAAGRESEVGKMRRLAAWFSAADPAPWRTAPAPGAMTESARTHVFLVGFPRSGTTLLEQALAGHPEVLALEEAPTLAEPYAEFLSSTDGLARLSTLGEADARIWRSRYWSEVIARGMMPAGKVFVDKAPAGTVYLPLVAKLFPDAKVLFAIRDPRDVVLSCFRNNFQLNAMTYAFTDLSETARCYADCMTMAEVYRRALPLDLMEVRHEALVEDFDAELAAIAGFLGIEVTPSMADVAATASRRTVRTPSAVQVRAGLNKRGMARWRAYADPLAPVLPMLAPWVERWGYAPD
jgi:tetratricopeptide (TPR) repeat protein